MFISYRFQVNVVFIGQSAGRPADCVCPVYMSGETVQSNSPPQEWARMAGVKLTQFFLFNPSWGPKEGEEEKKVFVPSY